MWVLGAELRSSIRAVPGPSPCYLTGPNCVDYQEENGNPRIQFHCKFSISKDSKNKVKKAHDKLV